MIEPREWNLWHGEDRILVKGIRYSGEKIRVIERSAYDLKAKQLDEAKKTIELMMARCGLPDKGDALQEVLRTGKEFLKTME